MLRRRALLTGTAAGLLAGCGSRGSGAGTPSTTASPTATPTIPDVPIGPVEIGTFRSRHRLGQTTRWSLVRPPGVRGRLPVVVCLHGMGGSTAKLLEDLQLPRFLAAAVADGVPPFALATVSGGRGFWHPRPDGEDGGALVTDELLPRLARRDDVLPVPIGLYGWSMGGYGVLRLGGILGPERVGAVVASSPGLYTDPEEAHPLGFEDAAEYERFSVMDSQEDLAGIPVKVDCGTEDYFYDAVRAYVAGFPADADLETSFGPGGHELPYTLRMIPEELAFLGAHVGRT